MRFRHFAGARLSDDERGRDDLECSRCYGLKFSDGIAPICETGVCPIYDLATDPVLSRMLNSFVTQRALYEMNKSEMVYNRLCEDFGFIEDPDFHFQCEVIFSEWQANTREKRKKKRQ